MNRRNAAYWTTTVLAVFPLLVGGVAYLFRMDEVVLNFRELGYPEYLLMILGTFKLLGALVIAAPRLPRLKEWAYAGVAFNLVGAVLSHAAVGHSAEKTLAPLLLLSFTVASWALRPASRTTLTNVFSLGRAPEECVS
jgi:hypothetical protein